MTLSRGLAIAAALCGAAAIAGCGFGPGPTSAGTATLTVTRDYGSRTLATGEITDPSSSETVIRFLDREADITTRYGGGFVQSINGLSGTESGGRRYDWFFYVDGTESPVGAADVRVHPGDRIWWDYRDWTAAMSVPAVVGSWPEPFAQASSGKPMPVRVVCLGARPACRVTANRLARAGVSARLERNGGNSKPGSAMRLLVGTWDRVRADRAVDELRSSPQSTGIFATFKGPVHGGWHLIGLDTSGDPARDLGSGAGLVAALGRAGQPPTWIVTGSGRPAVRHAASALDSGSLGNRYAVAATGHGTVPLPILGRGASK